MKSEKEHWNIVIKPHSSKFALNYGEVWKYRDLIKMYVHRDIVTAYKQTVLGPLWYLIQPLFTTFMYIFVFGGIAQIPTDGLPQSLFYLSGILSWGYFSECLGRGMGTFSGNADVFSKVYFPRLVVPIAGALSGLVRYAIQLSMLLIIYLFYYFDGAQIEPNITLLLFPLYTLMLAGLGLGFGIIISSMTTKYRDLGIFFGFLTSLWMYATPIIYPLSAVPNKISGLGLKWIVEANPLTPIVEAMKYSLLGTGMFSWTGLAYSFLVTIVVLIIGSWVFNKVERNFIDIV